jgi:hypothetical protein
VGVKMMNANGRSQPSQGQGSAVGRAAPCSSRRNAIISSPSMSTSIPQDASEAILKHSEPVPDEAVAVQGPNFDERPTLESLLGSYERIGFQANSLGKAINIVNKMVGASLSSIYISPHQRLHLSVAGVSPMSQFLLMNRSCSLTLKFAPKRAVTYFLAILRISYLLAFAKSFYTL